MYRNSSKRVCIVFIDIWYIYVVLSFDFWLKLSQTSLFLSNQFVFFQTSSIIEVRCKEGAVVRTLASHQCGLEVPLNG